MKCLVGHYIISDLQIRLVLLIIIDRNVIYHEGGTNRADHSKAGVTQICGKLSLL